MLDPRLFIGAAEHRGPVWVLNTLINHLLTCFGVFPRELVQLLDCLGNMSGESKHLIGQVDEG
ncbi:hypothetical protein D3C87_1959420 [compost metagenome]